MSSGFDYAIAFDRNIGWVTSAEQATLRRKRVAIAGMGGVGGVHLLTLARLGVGAFRIADFDAFDLPNFNRQAGATLPTLGKPKVDVLGQMATDINPELTLDKFPAGVNRDNVGDFLNGVDVYVDGLDFFAFETRDLVFDACERQGIPVITVAPIGMGAALLTFMPGRMGFREYFGWEGKSESEKALHFLVGLAPAGLHRGYLVDPTRVRLAERSGPSTIMACQLCAGIAATETLKLLLGRGKVIAAPHGVHFDAYRNKLVRTWRPWGYRNPLQQVVLAVGRRQLARTA